MDKNKTFILSTVITIITAIALITGTNSFWFPTNGIATPDSASLAKYSELGVSERPNAVDAPAKADPMEMDAMFSLSTSAFPSIQLMSENGIFSYTQSDARANLDECVNPTNISVRCENSERWVAFSGCIYRIDYDYIYIATAGHCILRDCSSLLSNAEIVFFDRTVINADLSEYRFGANYSKSYGDYGMYRIPTSAVPYSTLVNLREVNIDETVIDSLEYGDSLYTGNINVNDRSVDYNIDTSVIGDCYDWGFSTEFYFYTDDDLFQGMSGSAIFDMNGNLVGVCSGGGGDVGIWQRADRFDELYQSFIDEDTGVGEE